MNIPVNFLFSTSLIDFCCRHALVSILLTTLTHSTCNIAFALFLFLYYDHKKKIAEYLSFLPFLFSSNCFQWTSVYHSIVNCVNLSSCHGVNITRVLSCSEDV